MTIALEVQPTTKATSAKIRDFSKGAAFDALAAVD
jgi:hypothetical protein